MPYCPEHYQKNKVRIKAYAKAREERQKLEDPVAFNALKAAYAMKSRDKNPVRATLVSKKAQCKRAGLDFNLTEDWYLAHFNVCEVTGIELEPPRSGQGPWQAEIDRRDPTKGYTMDNCRLVCRMYNLAKNEYNDADVRKMAECLI